jgi:hypothetical protein
MSPDAPHNPWNDAISRRTRETPLKEPFAGQLRELHLKKTNPIASDKPEQPGEIASGMVEIGTLPDPAHFTLGEKRRFSPFSQSEAAVTSNNRCLY